MTFASRTKSDEEKKELATAFGTRHLYFKFLNQLHSPLVNFAPMGDAIGVSASMVKGNDIL